MDRSPTGDPAIVQAAEAIDVQVREWTVRDRIDRIAGEHFLGNFSMPFATPLT